MATKDETIALLAELDEASYFERLTENDFVSALRAAPQPLRDSFLAALKARRTAVAGEAADKILINIAMQDSLVRIRALVDASNKIDITEVGDRLARIRQAAAGS